MSKRLVSDKYIPSRHGLEALERVAGAEVRWGR